MGLDRKYTEIEEKRNHTNEEIKLIESYNSRLKNGTLELDTRVKGPSLAYKIANAKTSEEREKLTRIQAKLAENELKFASRHWDAKSAIAESPNYFLTISMNYCHSSKWKYYDRDYKTKKLYITALKLIKKLLLEIVPTLKDKPFEEWPFFIGTMEHFDDKGNLVAPHMHILLKLDVDIRALREAIERLWNKAIPNAGKNDIDLQSVDERNLDDRAFYIFKHAHQDHQDKLDNGVDPDKICYRYGWTRDSVAHDKWRIDRNNFREALKFRLSGC